MPRSLLTLAITLLLATALRGAEEPLPYRIVQPTGEAHELLPKTCGVCHKEDGYKFFLVASPTQEGLEQALAALKKRGGTEFRAIERPKNPHAATACPFCHMQTPEKGENPAAMQFRTAEGEAVSLVDEARLCEMCHPKAQAGHVKVLGSGDAAADLKAAGLPVRDGKVLCSTCHDMHGNDVGPAGVRKEYLSFVASSAASYPHGNRTACLVCHPEEQAEGSEPTFREPDPTQRCVRCHPEDHGKIHPVALAPSDKTFPMTFLQYPLDAEGKMTCSTCHDHPCSPKAASSDRNFLRGGPYPSFTEFCYRCHPKAGKGGLNPHLQVDDKGNVVTATCTFCHKTAPTSDAYDPSELLFLRSPVELCVRCHDQGPHPGTNHLVELPPVFAQRLEEYQKRHKINLPLDSQGRITCTTCHNPHAKGVLRGEAALGAGEQHRWRVPSFAELCAPCHTRYD